MKFGKLKCNILTHAGTIIEKITPEISCNSTQFSHIAVMSQARRVPVFTSGILTLRIYVFFLDNRPFYTLNTNCQVKGKLLLLLLLI